MKLIHLSDLHLGKRVNDVSMIDDQKYILQQILDVIDEEQPKAVLIAGDVYDKSVPSAEAVELLDGFLFALAQRKLQISLAISLHGPNDEVRDRIMPVNKAYPMDVLLAACRRYFDATGRRIHFEYAMIDGVNDSVEDAKELLRRMKGLPAHFNLIPLNHVEESPLKPSSRSSVAAFQKCLEDGGITATVRRTLGGDIDASCGQLRRKYTKGQ